MKCDTIISGAIGKSFPHITENPTIIFGGIQ